MVFRDVANYVLGQEICRSFSQIRERISMILVIYMYHTFPGSHSSD